MNWTGSILLNDNSKLKDVTIDSLRSGQNVALSDGASLRYLSVVETCRIPICLAISQPCSVSTTDVDTERWFINVLFSRLSSNGGEGRSSWWKSARPDSPLGILVSVEGQCVPQLTSGLGATEILFYATSSNDKSSRPPTTRLSAEYSNEASEKSEEKPVWTIKALPLSSDLLPQVQDGEPSPPASPAGYDEQLEAVFFPTAFAAETETINEPPVRKRKSAVDAFDVAAERRRKARRKGGEGVAAAAATKSESQELSLQHRRSLSNSQSVPLQTRTLLRYPSVSSSRPPTAAAPSKRSTLSNVQSATDNLQKGKVFDVQNKELISRIVLAGMRLHGLVQSSRRKSRASSSAPSSALDVSFEEVQAEGQSDEEFKLVYHQVFKGTCFALRAHIGRVSLHTFSDSIRDVVDRLLAIYCTDPLAQIFGTSTDKLTPGGRRAFGSINPNEQKNPFSTSSQEAANDIAPNSRKRSKDR